MTVIDTGNWRLDEGQGQVAGDSTGNRNNGQLSSNAPDWIGGRKPGSTALHFDGETLAEAANTNTLTVLETPTVTAEAWVRSCNPGNLGYILSKGGEECIAASYALYAGGTGGLFFYIYRGGGSFVLSPDAGPSVWNGNWHHVAGTYDGQIVRLYVDGQEIGAGTTVPAPSAIAYALPSRKFCIGGYEGTCHPRFTGDITEVRIWNGSLSAGEVLARAQGQELS